MIKEGEIIEFKKNIRLMEGEVAEVTAKIKKLETQQNSIKKVEEFNALSHEMSQAERERVGKEQRLSDLYDKLAAEEEILKKHQEKSRINNRKQQSPRSRNPRKHRSNQ